MDRDEELGQYPAILTSRLVNNPYLFLRLGSSSANPSGKRISSKKLFIPEEFETSSFVFSVDGKHFETGAFRFPSPSFPQAELKSEP